MQVLSAGVIAPAPAKATRRIGGTHPISLFFNQGDGTFKDPVTYPFAIGETIGGIPPSMVSSDLDGDSQPDLAVLSHGGDWPHQDHVNVLLGLGDGTFKDPVRSVAGCAEFLIPTDIDGDGKLDMIGSDASVLLGNGDGTFQDWGISFCNESSVVIAADFNTDGKLDFVLGSVADDGIGPKFFFLNFLFNDGGEFNDEGLGSYSVGGSSIAVAADLNGDGNLDVAALTSDGRLMVLLNNHPTPPHSFDLNQNGIPDECELRPFFHRGDPNSSGTTDISDAIAIFGFLFLGDPPTLSCRESADANHDDKIDISDGIYLLQWLFTGGPEPAAPGPTGAPCGFDPDPPGSPGDLGCESYSCK